MTLKSAFVLLGLLALGYFLSISEFMLSALCLIAFGYLFYSIHKLEQFRSYVSPGNTVRLKSGMFFTLVVIKSRPNRETVSVIDLYNDRDHFVVPINKIYPL